MLRIVMDGAGDLPSALQAALASLLNVKPVVVLRDGVLDRADRVCTRHRALDHTLNCNGLVLMDLSISVAANLGPGTVGIVAYPVEEG